MFSELSRLDAYRNEQKDAFANVVAVFKTLGEEIRSAKYHRLSTYVFEQPDTVTQREGAIDKRFDTLSEKALDKEGTLKAALDLENRKEAKRVEYACFQCFRISFTENKLWLNTVCAAISAYSFLSLLMLCCLAAAY